MLIESNRYTLQVLMLDDLLSGTSQRRVGYFYIGIPIYLLGWNYQHGVQFLVIEH